MNGSTLKIPPNVHDHRIGSLHAPVILIEYGDFQCPHCQMTVPILDTLVKEYGQDLCFIYRHFPLSTIHSNAGVAAVASEAADAQGQFWQMHHLLFENQFDLSSENIFELARTLNLDMKLFLDDLEREDLSERVRVDFNSGVRSGVNGTPTLFLNNLRFDGAPTLEMLEDVINKLISDNRAAI
ncbi:DsbA family protein [Peredibacter sp. HCB2-198]|uniref:DsbA family protein n=1 Tax=Peredibacter sp. HCB2-198 TaxID=3383025 RepID=UPI0038B47A82